MLVVHWLPLDPAAKQRRENEKERECKINIERKYGALALSHLKFLEFAVAVFSFFFRSRVILAVFAAAAAHSRFGYWFSSALLFFLSSTRKLFYLLIVAISRFCLCSHTNDLKVIAGEFQCFWMSNNGLYSLWNISLGSSCDFSNTNVLTTCEQMFAIELCSTWFGHFYSTSLDFFFVHPSLLNQFSLCPLFWLNAVNLLVYTEQYLWSFARFPFIFKWFSFARFEPASAHDLVWYRFLSIFDCFCSILFWLFFDFDEMSIAKITAHRSLKSFKFFL